MPATGDRLRMVVGAGLVYLPVQSRPVYVARRGHELLLLDRYVVPRSPIAVYGWRLICACGWNTAPGVADPVNIWPAVVLFEKHVNFFDKMAKKQ